MKDWKELSVQVADIARLTGRWIAEEQRGFKSEHVEIKDHNSLVSYVDKKAEEQLVEGPVSCFQRRDSSPRKPL